MIFSFKTKTILILFTRKTSGELIERGGDPSFPTSNSSCPLALSQDDFKQMNYRAGNMSESPPFFCAPSKTGSCRSFFNGHTCCTPLSITKPWLTVLTLFPGFFHYPELQSIGSDNIFVLCSAAGLIQMESE